MGSMKSWLDKWLGGGPNGEKRVTTFRLLLVVGLIGVALMILHSFYSIPEPGSPKEAEETPGPPAQAAFLGGASQEKSPFRNYEAAYENALRELLLKVVGVGDVEVLVTIESTEEVVVKDNMKDAQQVTDEKDPGGATRHITDITRSGEVVLYQSSQGQSPLVLTTIKPKIRGVVVVARGAENMTVKRMIQEAVSRGLDVPAHRISILPRKQ
jgi:stage III sporulation protein AG